jgi:DNA-binding NarL/FixJ family response regulator
VARPRILRRADVRPREPEPPALLHLTGQEARIALLIAAGRTNRQIADELYLSIKTIEGHHAIYRKLGVRSRVELTVKLLTQPTDEAEAS